MIEVWVGKEMMDKINNELVIYGILCVPTRASCATCVSAHHSGLFTCGESDDSVMRQAVKLYLRFQWLDYNWDKWDQLWWRQSWRTGLEHRVREVGSMRGIWGRSDWQAVFDSIDCQHINASHFIWHNITDNSCYCDSVDKWLERLIAFNAIDVNSVTTGQSSSSSAIAGKPPFSCRSDWSPDRRLCTQFKPIIHSIVQWVQCFCVAYTVLTFIWLALRWVQCVSDWSPFRTALKEVSLEWTPHLRQH